MSCILLLFIVLSTCAEVRCWCGVACTNVRFLLMYVIVIMFVSLASLLLSSFSLISLVITFNEDHISYSIYKHTGCCNSCHPSPLALTLRHYTYGGHIRVQQFNAKLECARTAVIARIRLLHCLGRRYHRY